MIVGDIQGAVHVVEAEGQLAAQIQILSRQAGIPLACVQLIEGLTQLLLIQQLQGGGIVLGAHPIPAGLEGQSILEGGRIEGLMVGICAAVDDGNAGACAGIAGFSLDVCSAGHFLGHHISDVGLHGYVAGFQIYGFDAGQLGDCVQLSVGNIGGNGVFR